MKTINAIVIATAIAAPAAASAGSVTGFAPWENARIESTPDAVQRDIAVKPWGVSYDDWQFAPASGEAPDERQVNVMIAPFYARGAI